MVQLMAKDGRTGSTFPQKLYRARVAAGLSQSDLARKVWGETTDNRGYKVARNRDRITMYEKGRVEPTRENLIAIAEALGMKPEELAPEKEVIERGQPAIKMTMVEGKPDQVHLQVNTITSLTVASKIIAMLSDGDNDNRK